MLALLSLYTVCMFSSLELKQYLPPLDELMTKMDEINAFCQGQIAAMQSLGPQEAKIRFIGNLLSPPLIPSLLLSSTSWWRQLSSECFVFVFQISWPPCLCLVPTISWPRRSPRKASPLHAWSASAKQGCCSSTPEVRYACPPLIIIFFHLLWVCSSHGYFPQPDWTKYKRIFCTFFAINYNTRSHHWALSKTPKAEK